MDINEVKKKIAESPHKKWFNEINLSINFICVGLNKSFNGFVNLFDFFQTQTELWSTVKDQEIGNMKESKSYFTTIHQDLEKLLVASPNKNQNELYTAWNGILAYIQTKPDKYFTYNSIEAEFLLDVYKNYPMAGYSALQFLRGEAVSRNNNADDILGNSLASQFRISKKNPFRGSENAPKNDFEKQIEMSFDEIMLPKRQKQILDKIIELGFINKDFEFIPMTNDDFRIQYNHKSHYNYTHKDKRAIFSPGNNNQLKTTLVSKGFLDGLKYISVWLTEMKENLSIGNPWSKEPEINDFFNNDNFSPYEELLNVEEQKLLSEKLDLLLDQFEQLKIDTTQIKKDVEHIKDMSDKISKKDIMLLILGTITSSIFAGIIDQEQATSVWKLIGTFFGNFKNKLIA